MPKVGPLADFQYHCFGLLISLTIGIFFVASPPLVNFTVKVTFASQDEIHYDTGIGLEGAENSVEVRVFDRCIYSGGANDPVEVGAWYPSSISNPIQGITTDVATINAPSGTGPGNVIGWGFDADIETNIDVYTRIDDYNAELKVSQMVFDCFGNTRMHVSPHKVRV